ncbi:MAG: deoxyribose-phosphate aldolase [Bifidobacteriaceae bacterium]|jgi:deoxyribose-phosphate aldolase|nr:deoxyribose-phosphate aldolase [Bifidobacteriaceae bacterium]
MNVRFEELDPRSLARMIDVSAVYRDAAMADVDRMVAAAKRFNCVCASTMPWATSYAIEQLRDSPAVQVVGNVAFPAGAETTKAKVAAAAELVALGCAELDVVVNVNALKSGLDALVRADLTAVVDAAQGRPVKAIVEAGLLGEDELARVSSLAVQAGAAFVKTGTGWLGSAATVSQVQIIRRVIGDSAAIKASGGIRSLSELEALLGAGATRFGVGVRSLATLMRQAADADRAAAHRRSAGSAGSAESAGDDQAADADRSGRYDQAAGSPGQDQAARSAISDQAADADQATGYDRGAEAAKFQSGTPAGGAL